MSEEEKRLDEEARKANMVSDNEFKILTQRVDTMESSIGNIVTRVSKYFKLSKNQKEMKKIPSQINLIRDSLLKK
jgi:hypothetical protein